VPNINRLGRDFFNRNTLQVARELLGKQLVRIDQGERIAGLITETEAYIGEQDLACHARAGLTPRTRVMYGSPGYAYIYFTYGMHWMLNIVTEEPAFPAAVLLRALQPTEGLDLIALRRAGRPPAWWTDGPAKLCQALGIDGALNGIDLCDTEAALFLEEGIQISDRAVTTGPRVGLNSVPEPWKSVPWRYKIISAFTTESAKIKV
jgi:DNA-3-methyladenine glycosylase